MGQTPCPELRQGVLRFDCCGETSMQVRVPHAFIAHPDIDSCPSLSHGRLGCQSETLERPMCPPPADSHLSSPSLVMPSPLPMPTISAKGRVARAEASCVATSTVHDGHPHRGGRASHGCELSGGVTSHALLRGRAEQHGRSSQTLGG